MKLRQSTSDTAATSLGLLCSPAGASSLATESVSKPWVNFSRHGFVI
ncbi:hypothetical protein [Pseudomonas sp. FG-3G]|nr:hypothetical protein [Pseudomonas sp. FG-3G]